MWYFFKQILSHIFYNFIVIVSIVRSSYLEDNSIGSFANLFDFQEIFNLWHFAQYSWFFTSWMLCGHIHFECWILSTLNQLQMNSTRLLSASSSGIWFLIWSWSKKYWKWKLFLIFKTENWDCCFPQFSNGDDTKTWSSEYFCKKILCELTKIKNWISL